jgi:N-dimethylarginine dimethylaminohydrolase
MTTLDRIVMCAPDHYCVDYVINPWMEHQIGQADMARARKEWEALRGLLAEHAELLFVPPQPRLPDMVFTANAGLAFDRTVVLSRFMTDERRPEEPFFQAFFEAQGFAIAPWPQEIPFEGAGDALLDEAREMIWCGHGWRTSPEAPPLLEEIFGQRVVGLRLVDPRFYHLDTCFCPLADGWLMYYPAAFDAESVGTIERLVPPERRLDVELADAAHFACNAVESGGRVILNEASVGLQHRLREAGFTPTLTPLSEFIKAGGAAKCLTLKLIAAPAGEAR